MKNTTLTLTFNTERLDALAYHMGKKEADLKEELSDYLQKMYEKYVPPAVREYIESRESGEGRAGMRGQERRNTTNREEDGTGERKGREHMAGEL